MIHTVEKQEAKTTPELIVMLTYNDLTVRDAGAIFEECRGTRARWWGIKEEPLASGEMKSLFARMRECGKGTVLEVVAYTERECLAGAKLAAECGCDVLAGTMYFDSVRDVCRGAGIKYMPFVGKVSGRPSILAGTPEEMIARARECVGRGAWGVDLLGYRYTGDAAALNARLVGELDAPVCVAGSVDSYARLDEIKQAAPRFFTVGSAFFDGKFGGTFAEQIDAVVAYMEK